MYTVNVFIHFYICKTLYSVQARSHIACSPQSQAQSDMYYVNQTCTMFTKSCTAHMHDNITRVFIYSVCNLPQSSRNMLENIIPMGTIQKRPLKSTKCHATLVECH